MWFLKTFALGNRDVRSYLNSFSFYLWLAFFLGVSGYFFWSNLSYFSLMSFQAASNPQVDVRGLNLTEGVVSPFLSNLSVLLLLLIPILSMRSFAEEKRLGTLELLFSYPVSDFQIVAGKFAGLMILIILMLSPTILYFFLASSAIGIRFEVLSLLAAYLGLLLLAASFASLGMFVSSLTEHQAVSAGIGFVILLFFWIVGWMAEWVSPALGLVFRELSLVEHFRDMTRGVLDTKDLAFFLLFIGFFLFAAVSSLEVRTWKR